MGVGGFDEPRPKNTPQGCFCPTGRKASDTGCSNPPARLIYKWLIYKETRYFLKSISFWWELVDSNHRSITQQIYSLSPLATRESSPIQLCIRRLAYCSIIIAKTFTKSKPFLQKNYFISFQQQCFSKEKIFDLLACEIALAFFCFTRYNSYIVDMSQ